MKICGIIPARKGSKGIKDKNFHEICGVPMIEFTIGAATNSGLDEVFITTDYDVTLFNTKVIKRPAELCGDNTKMIEVLQHAHECVGKLGYDAYMILQPTSPLRTNDDINYAIECFNQTREATSLYSGFFMGIKHKDRAYDKWIDKPHFQRNGSIFIVTKELLEQGKLWDEKVIEFMMPKSRSIDIDDMDDVKMAEALLMYDMMEG